MCWSPGSADRSVRPPWPACAELLDVAAARAFVERDRGQHVGAQRELARLAEQAALRIDQLGVRQHDELDGARAWLTRRQVAGDARAGVVLDGDAMTDEIVQLRVVRHSGLAISRSVAPRITGRRLP